MKKPADTNLQAVPEANGQYEPLHPDSFQPHITSTIQDIRHRMQVDHRNAVDYGGDPLLYPPSLRDPNIPLALSMLLDQAKSVVMENWRKYVNGEMEQRLAEVAAQLPDSDEAGEIRDVLQKKELFEELLHSHRLGVLESLRTIAPALWQSLLYMSSQIQREEMGLLWKWINDEERGISDAQLQRMGLSRAELRLLLEVSSFFQKAVDHAHIKAVGSPGREEDFASHSEHPVTVSLAQRQPWEGKKLVRRLHRMAMRIEKHIAKGQLDHTYAKLPEYLRQVADVYGLNERDVDVLSDLRQKLDTATAQLAESGCPLMLVTQSSYDEDPGNEIELRVGVRTPKTVVLEERLQGFRRSAQDIVDLHHDCLAEPGRVPPTLCNEQLFGFGCNLSWMTPADARRNLIVVSTNTIGEECVGSYQALRRVLKGFSMDEQDYRDASAEDAALHEIAHTVLWSEDPHIQGRIGTGDAAMMIDELKADTVSMVLQRDYLRQLRHASPSTDVSALASRKLTSTVGGLCDYLLNNSDEEGNYGQRYYFTAIVILHKLLTENILQRDGAQYVITDPIRGIEVIAEISDEVIGFYAHPETTPEVVTRRYEEWKLLKDDAHMQEFLETLGA